MEKYKKNVLVAASFAWIFFVFASWFKWHFAGPFFGSNFRGLFYAMWESSPTLKNLLSINLFLLVLMLFVVWNFWKTGDTKMKITVSPVRMFWYLTVISSFLFFLFYFLYSDNFSGGRASAQIIFDSYAIFLARLSIQLVWMAVFALSFFLLGRLVRWFVGFSEGGSEKNYSFLLTTSLGILGWIFTGFLLGLSGKLSFWPISLFLVLIYAFSAKYLIRSYGQFSAKREYFFDFRKLEIWIWLLVFFMFSLNVIFSMRPVPVGFDDSVYYLNKVRLMHESGRLEVGGYPFPAEILMTIGQLFSKNASLAIAANVIFSVLGFFALYGIANQFFGKRAGLLSAAFWYSFPFTSHLVLGEVKPDMLLFFISAMAFWSFVLWIRNLENEALAYVSFLLFGLAFSVKLTAFFAIFPLSIIYIYFTFRKKASFSGKTPSMFFSFLAFCIPLLPWVFLGFSTMDSEQPFSPLSIIKSQDEQNVDLRIFNRDENVTKFSKWKKTGSEEDFGRFSQPKSSLGQLFFFWDLSMNNRLKMYATEIGFFFLAILVPLIVYWKKYSSENKLVKNVLGFVLFIYGLLWMFFGEHVPWYAYVGFLFFILVSVSFSLSQKIPKIIGSTLLFLLVFSIFLNAFVLSWRSNSASLTKYLAGEGDADSIYFPELKEITSVLSGDINSRVLVTASRFPYFIENYSRVVDDRYLDIFSFLNQEKDAAKTLERLKKLEIKYLILNTGLKQIDDKNGTLRKKYDDFMDFSEKNLLLEKKISGSLFFRVP